MENKKTPDLQLLIKSSQSLDPFSSRAREELFNEIDPIIKKLSRQLNHNPTKRKDLYQEGCVGFLEGLARFDPTKGVRLTTYLWPIIRGRMLQYLRDEACYHWGQLYFSSPLPSAPLDSSEERTLEDIIGHEGLNGSPEVKTVQIDSIRKASQVLSVQQKEVIRLRYSEDLLPSEIAAELVVSRPRITRVLQEAHSRLAEQLALAA